jgi:UrcA family protein
MRTKQLFPAVLILSGLPLCAVAEQTEYATVVAEVDVPSKVVRYGDLNLQRQDGVATLYRRIQLAANSVCTQVNHRMPQVALRERICATDATARAVAHVGVPALAQLHAQVTGQPSKLLASRESR